MGRAGAEITLDEYFSGQELSRRIFDVLEGVVTQLGPHDVRATKSQVAFRRGRAFAWAWTPDRYLGAGHAPLVLSVALSHRDGSPRWKQVVEPARGRFMHHLELRSEQDIDDEVAKWLAEAASEAGQA
jgi:hypothetical protein